MKQLIAAAAAVLAPVINVYELDDDLSAFSVLRFDSVDETWLDFVCDCRDGKDVYSSYDAIIGRVAAPQTVAVFLLPSRDGFC